MPRSWKDEDSTKRKYIIDESFKDQAGTEWEVVHEFQTVHCPHRDCGKKFWCRLTHVTIEKLGIRTTIPHNNYSEDKEKLKSLLTEYISEDNMKYVTEVQKNGEWILETNDEEIFGRVLEGESVRR